MIWEGNFSYLFGGDKNVNAEKKEQSRKDQL